MVLGIRNKTFHIAKTFIVTIDFDGTIALRQRLKVIYAKKLFGINITEEQGKESTFPLGPEKYKYLLNLIEKKAEEYDLAPHCHEVLTTLYNFGFRFALVTSRTDENLRSAMNFVRCHSLPISYFHPTNDVPKDYICNKLHSRAMIDDTFSKLVAMHNTPVSLYFFRQSWNSHEMPIVVPSEINIVNSWIEFYDKLLHLKQLQEAVCYFEKWENNFLNFARIGVFIKSNPSESNRLLEEYLSLSRSL